MLTKKIISYIAVSSVIVGFSLTTIADPNKKTKETKAEAPATSKPQTMSSYGVNAPSPKNPVQVKSKHVDSQANSPNERPAFVPGGGKPGEGKRAQTIVVKPGEGRIKTGYYQTNKGDRGRRP
ncbi:MAG: hypothetical protein ACO1QB_11470 [Verrucomicrobiales bacterium]